MQSTSSSSLAKQIWKASVRSVRSPSIWETYSKQVVSQVPFLGPRDIATVIHSFARVKFRDDKLLGSLVPSILKNMDEFSVRELVDILSSFRKLEYSRLDCLDLMVNQLVLKANEWNEMDCALIANGMGYFRVFDRSIWRCIEKIITVKKRGGDLDFCSLGIGLIVGALAKLDMRNERILKRLSRALVQNQTSRPQLMKQESFAVILHGFYKLDWTEDYMLNQFLEDQISALLEENESVDFFDNQSICMILHALFCYRLADQRTSLTPQQSEILTLGVSKLAGQEQWDPSPDQRKRLEDLVTLYETETRELKKKLIITRKDVKKKISIKLPRWEYEVLRILKDKMQVPVKRKNRKVGGRTDMVIISPHDDSKVVVILCLGPFQYYADSTKRTSCSKLLRLTLEAGKNNVIEIPFFIWNELKTDQDKIMYLYSLGRRALAGGDTYSNCLTS